jgi:hypothetical protein
MQTLVDLAALTNPSKRAARLRKRLKLLRHTLGSRRDLDMILDKLRERAANTCAPQKYSCGDPRTTKIILCSR